MAEQSPNERGGAGDDPGAECEFCGQPMLDADSCTKNVILYPSQEGSDLDGVYQLAVEFGGEDQWEADTDCHDCGVSPGGHHHPGCDVEESPMTGGQLLMEVVNNPPERTPLHAHVVPDPHQQISLEDIHQEEENQ